MSIYSPLLLIVTFVLTIVVAWDLDVETSVGKVVGFVDPAVPNVNQWLGVPFAEPPVGSLRFLPPVAKSFAGVIDTQKPSLSCQQWLTSKPDLYNTLEPAFLPPGPYSEDCLYLNVITPREPEESSLPVLVWVHGGMLTYGGINTPYEKPQNWVARSQQHIVVQISYRLNIFGFPNAKGLSENNLGILDQRLALEWVRSNIRNFGGDPERITFWGQSAGAGTIDAHQFAFASDPIFSSVLLESGVALLAQAGTDANQTSFGIVAQKFGCPSNSSPTAEVDCMRKVDAGAIEKFLQNYTDSATTPALYFSPVADGKIAFLPQQYVAMGEAGEFANVPMLVGSNAQEGSAFVPFSISGAGLTPALIEGVTLKVIQCPVAVTCQYRQASKRTTFRYFYAGNFSNISPTPWLGSYHFAELPLIMGTDGEYVSASTPFEVALSHKMQDLWLSFAKDPMYGVIRQGWYPYSSNGTALVLGVNTTLVSKESIAALDAGCAAS
ncbi:hypothetical protein MMC11_007099 [Xylographa trunciseda]|nr:hypothetical protein [Xylographa trunciseda]